MSVQKPNKKCVQKRYMKMIDSCENGRCARSVIDDSVITCDEIIETAKSIIAKSVAAKSVLANLNEKKVICRIKNVYILLAFLLITATYKYPAKQKKIITISRLILHLKSWILITYYEKLRVMTN